MQALTIALAPLALVSVLLSIIWELAKLVDLIATG